MLRHRTWVSLSLLACITALVGSADAAPKKRPKKPADAPATEEVVAEFDKRAAVTAIAEVSLQKCKSTSAATGEGHVTITFAPAGAVQTALVDKGPWLGTPVAKCMQKEFKKAKVPAFKGEPVTVGKTFHLE